MEDWIYKSESGRIDFGFVNVEKWLAKNRDEPNKIEGAIRTIENQLEKDYASMFWLRKGAEQIIEIVDSMADEIKIRKVITEMEKNCLF